MAVVIAGSLFILAVIVYLSKWRSISPVALVYFGCLVLFQALLEKLNFSFLTRYQLYLIGFFMVVLIPFLLLFLAYLMLSRIEQDREVSWLRILFNLVISATFIATVGYTVWVTLEKNFLLAHILSVYSLIGIYLIANFLFFIIVNGLLRFKQVPKKLDALIVLGSRLDKKGNITLELKRRLNKTAAIYKERLVNQGEAPIIYVTGGINRQDTPSESLVMAAYLRDQGIPAASIKMEGESTSTKENLRNVRLMLSREAADVQTLIITSHFHLLRSYFYAWYVGMNLQIIGVAGVGRQWPFAVIREFIAFFILTKELNYLWMIAYLLYGINEAMAFFL